jgi:hypothetical protein
VHRPHTLAEVFKNGPRQVADETKMGTVTGERRRERERERERERKRGRGREGERKQK